MFILANQDNEQVGKELRNLRNVIWAERVNFKSGENKGKAKQPKVEGSNYKVGDSQTLVDGTVLTIHRVDVRNDPASGGERKTGLSGIQYDAEGFYRVQSWGDKPPPAPDPVPGDEGYNHVELRRPHMPDLGDQADDFLKYLVAIRMQQSAIADAVNGITSIADQAEKDALIAAFAPLTDLPQGLDNTIGKWLAVKARFPKE